MPSENSGSEALSTVREVNSTHTDDPPGQERQLSPDAEEVCGHCFGTGVEVVSGKGARVCRCRLRDTRRKLLQAARIPRRYSRCSLDNFQDLDNSGSIHWAHLKARTLVNDYPGVEKGLLLMGPVGVGKTHLAVAILKGLLEKGVRCLFYESGSLLKKIQDSYNPISKSSELRVLSPVYQSEVLVLDELGSTVPTDWVRDTIYQIINTRYNDRKLTIFTTNYQDEPRIPEVEPRNNDRSQRKLSSSAKELTTLEERIGTRLRSRLYEMCNKVLIEGEDYRKLGDRRQHNSPL